MNIFGKNTEKQAPETEQAPLKTPTQPARSPKMLNATQFQRTKEMKRLAETKLSNLEDRLELLRKQQEWLRRYNELKIELQHEKTKLFELNKLQASMIEDIRQLGRYEMFESIQGTFQRITVLEKLVDQNKRNLSLLERDSDELRKAWDKQEKIQGQAESLRKNAEKRLRDIHENIFLSFHLLGSNQASEEEIGNLSELGGKANLLASILENNIAETEQEIEFLSDELAHHKAGRQSMEMHEQMLVHSEAILLRLDNLQEIEEQQQKLKNLQANALQKQDEENKLLERVFSKYQELTSEADILESELETHRSNILGQESYKLQERSMQLKSRKQMLLTAQSLWHQISVGYSLIEEKTKTLNDLRLHIDHVECNIKDMENVVGKLSRLCHEKEHTYLLSKGQNIIQLRADLQEGVSCSVCGATHHPYHSDTMLDQSKLIGEFKTEYELLAAELHNKQQQLNDLRLDLAESKGRQFSEESSLNAIWIRQNDDVKEWNIYSSLDKSFQECSQSTNMDARMAMIRHLIESATNDAENAQKELDTFNYHMSQITKLSEKLQKLESQKNELNVRLNEVNTGCQVRAGQVERVLAMIDNENTRYNEVYNHLDKIISIKDWKSLWDNNHESLREQIQKLTNAWNIVNEQIVKEQRDLTLNKTKLEDLRQQQQAINSFMDFFKNRTEKCRSCIEENNKNIQKAIGEISPKQFYEEAYQHMSQARQTEDDEWKITQRMLHDIDHIKGRNEFHITFGKELSEKLSEERSHLDIWMHNFNTHHPPVQYTELKEVFDKEKDWEAIRSRVKNTLQDIALCQARVDSLNSQVIAIQAEANYQSFNDETLLETLTTQQENLEGKRHEIMLQIARLTVALEDHEKAVHAANNSAQNQVSDAEQN